MAPVTIKGTKRAAPTAPAVPAKRGHACPLCALTGPEHTFRHHMMLWHLSWFLIPLGVCWKCCIYVSEDMDTVTGSKDNLFVRNLPRRLVIGLVDNINKPWQVASTELL